MVEQTAVLDASLARFGQDKMSPKQIHRFFAKCMKVDLGYEINGEPSPCWVWVGASHPKGYGRFFLGMLDGKRVWAYSHRISYEHHIGPVPEGMVVDHECNNKACCNPPHLKAIHDLENLRLAAERRPWKRLNQYSGSEGVRVE